MKLISDGAFSVFCTDDLVYFIRRNPENHHDEFYKTDLHELEKIDLDEYAQTKFGNAWKTIHSAYAECIKLKNGQLITCHFEASIIYLHDQSGKKINELNIGRFDNGFDTIYSIALDKDNALWIAQPTLHYIGRFSLETEKELFSIGGDFENPETFDHPEEVRIYDDYAYICDMGNRRISRINIYNKELEEYLKFDEPVWEYRQFKEKELVRLQSGLYEL
jgi:hypothetical protein